MSVGRRLDKLERRQAVTRSPGPTPQSGARGIPCREALVGYAQHLRQADLDFVDMTDEELEHLVDRVQAAYELSPAQEGSDNDRGVRPGDDGDGPAARHGGPGGANLPP
jgi:hypothetical protein